MDQVRANHHQEAGWRLARRGIELALNNRVEEAQRVLRLAVANATNAAPGDAASRLACLQAHAGLAFLTFMNAVMTFEEEKMSLALATLRATEKRCSNFSPSSSSSSSSTSNGGGGGLLSASPSFTTLQSLVKSRVWSSVLTDENDPNREDRKPSGKEHEDGGSEDEDEAAARLEQQIIVADCQVLEAVLSFLKQEWTSYMKGGWALRKAWKVYQKCYGQIRRLYLATSAATTTTTSTPSSEHGTNNNNNSSLAAALAEPPSSSSSSSSTGRRRPISSGNIRGLSHSLSVPLSLFALTRSSSSSSSSSSAASNGNCDLNYKELPPAKDKDCPSISSSTVRRLMGAVSFGYGLFHLAVSLLPNKLLNVVHLLGFEGDRQTGIQALLFARQGSDMRAPIATLALLWFHTIVRPFFGLDGSNLKSGAAAAQRLIDASKPDFADSALFLFFQGRVDRLKSNFGGALSNYEAALSASAQREVRLLCLHEVGWSYVLLLRWSDAAKAFLQLKNESRWSQSFYCYLSSICLGAGGDLIGCLELAQETPRLVRRNTRNQLERFLNRRSAKVLTDNGNLRERNYFLLLAYELLYLWNALGACLKNSQAEILIDCQKIFVPALENVRQLILGSVYSNSGRVSEAKLCYGRAIKDVNSEDNNNDHAAAFAAYELGLLLCRSDETRDEGRFYLEYARDNYRGYDFEGRLNVRIQAALRYYSEDVSERNAQALISN